jgi:hypothetical protein
MSLKDRLRKKREEKTKQATASKGVPARPKTKTKPPLVEDQADEQKQTTKLDAGQLGLEVLHQADEKRMAGEDVDAAEVLQAVPDSDPGQLAPSIGPPLEEPPSARPPKEPTIAEPPPVEESDGELPSVEISMSDSAIHSLESDVAVGDQRVSSPESGAFDETLAKPPPPPTPAPPPVPVAKSKKTPLQIFIEKMKMSNAPIDEKRGAIRVRLSQEVETLRDMLGAETSDAELRHFWERLPHTPPHQRSDVDQYGCDIMELRQLQIEIEAKAINREQGGVKADSGAQEAAGSVKDTAAESPKAINGEPSEDSSLTFTDEMPAHAQSSGGKKGKPPNPGGNWFVRMLKNPTTYFAAGSTACMGTLGYRELVSQDGFSTFSRAIEWAWNNLPFNLPPIQVPAWSVATGFATVLTTIFIITEAVRRSRAKKEARILSAEEKEFAKYEKRKNYIIEEFTKILRTHSDTKTQADKILEALSTNERLFDYMDRFYRNSHMRGIVFEAVRLHPDIKKDFGMRMTVAETRLMMKEYFAVLAPLLNNREVRMDKLRQLYERRPLFRRKLVQLFEKNADGSWKSGMHERFENRKFDTETEAQIMPALLQELYYDYQHILQQEKAAAGGR